MNKIPIVDASASDRRIIADFFLKRYAAQTSKSRKHLYASAIKAMKLYQWPGNVRELKDIVLFAVFHAKDDTISEADIIFNLSDSSMTYDLSLRNHQRERDQILEAYQWGR